MRNAVINITKDIKTHEDLLKKYNSIMFQRKFNPQQDIEDYGVSRFFMFCVEKKMPVEDFIEKYSKIFDKEDSTILHNSKNAKELIKNSYILAKQEEENYYKKIEQNTNLSLFLKFENYTEHIIELLLPKIDFIKSKPFNDLSIIIVQPPKGFNKKDLNNLLILAEKYNQDFMIQESKYVGENELIDRNGLDSTVTLQKTIEAYNTLDKEIEKMNKLELSPFEKFLYIHDFAASKVYNKETCWDPALSRTFINAMTNDTIVCAGYANIMKAFCDKAGIECHYIAAETIENETNNLGDEEFSIFPNNPSHAANIVYLKDEKYNIDGYYFSDSCWDSKKHKGQYRNYYTYSALPIQDIQYIGQRKYFREDLIEALNIPKFSQPIELNSFYSALGNIYQDHTLVNLSLRTCVWDAEFHYAPQAKNCFNAEHIKKQESEKNYNNTFN